MRLPFIFAAAFVLAGASTPIQAQEQQPDYQVLLDDIVSTAADSANAGAILDFQGCGISYVSAQGIANRVSKTPMPTGEQLRIASIGKLYTAAIIHRLAQQGLVDLDMPATDYIVGDDLSGVPNANASLRQMLNHTSGVPDYYDEQSYLTWDWTLPLTPERVLAVARRRDTTNRPGAAYSYSNTNYHILALVAEAVSGQPLGELISAHILVPLELLETRYNTAHPGGSIHGYGRPLYPDEDTWQYAENTGPDSGITASTQDLSRLLSALFLEHDEMRSIGDAMIAEPVETDTGNQFAGPGAEMIVARSGRRLIGHTGDTFGYLTFAYAIPDYGATLIGHVNADDPDALMALLQSSALLLKDACSVPMP
ncbi:serine hydrolase domain-containing protein [Erythrobacter insulae]|nr:serine hydrolase domain-containing protein [Erythrobacter insulae]